MQQLCPVVIVFHSHDEVAAGKALFAVEYAGADALVVDIGALVGAGHDDNIVRPAVGVNGNECFDELTARQEAHFALTRCADAGQRLVSGRNEMAQASSFRQYG